MKKIRMALRLFRIILFAFMLAICMVIGVAPVIPKRKEQFAIEIKKEEIEKKENATASFAKQLRS